LIDLDTTDINSLAMSGVFYYFFNISKVETARGSRQKKTPPKAGFSGFSLNVLPCFHSNEKPSSIWSLTQDSFLASPRVSVG
jgi:hypothetical protein